ncbi:MAG: hypothetical protein Q9186_002767 [Xanthomendoza sp. 1 TL-2023]
MQPKDLRKLCGRLREDRLLAVHSRQEIREGLQRPINRDYYYIDFHATVDAIKYRVFHLTTKVKLMFRPSEEKKDFFCPRCKAQWTQMEILDSVGPMGFLCHRCGAMLEREEPSAGDASGSEKQVKLAAQLDRVLKLLQEIDNSTIPKNDFETALLLQIPVQRNKDLNPVRSTVPLEASSGRPAAVKGINQPVLQDLTVDLTSSAEKTAGEKLDEQQRKAAIAAQNVLPVWHTHSTVTAISPMEVRSGKEPDSDSDLTNGAINTSAKAETAEEDKKNGIKATIDENDELAAYYTRMAQEKEKEEREDREDEASSAVDDEEEEDEEDDDDFEDVGIDPTPSSLPPNLQVHTGNLKPPPASSEPAEDLASESASSAPPSVASTPAGALDDDHPLAKRVKLEVANGSEAVATRPVSDEDEEAEFEDAL